MVSRRSQSREPIVTDKETLTLHRAATWTGVALLGALLLALVFTIGYVSKGGGGDTGRSQETQRDVDDSADRQDIDFDTLGQIIDILNRDYIGRDNLNDQLLYESAIDGLLDSLADTGTF